MRASGAKVPAWVYAVSAGAGALGVCVPAFAPELVQPWEGRRALFVGAAAAAVLLHAALHAAFARSKLAPGALVALGALLVFALSSRALGWCAFVANAAASGPDLFEAFAARGPGPRKPPLAPAAVSEECPASSRP